MPTVVDPKAAVVSRRKPPWNVLSHKPPQNFGVPTKLGPSKSGPTKPGPNVFAKIL